MLNNFLIYFFLTLGCIQVFAGFSSGSALLLINSGVCFVCAYLIAALEVTFDEYR